MRLKFLDWFKKKEVKEEAPKPQVVPMKALNYPPKILVAWAKAIEGNKDFLDWLKEKVLTTDAIEKTKTLTNLAGDLGVSMPSLAIAWCLKNPNVSTVILGGSKTSHIIDNIKALEIQPLLTENVISEIELVLQNKGIMV